MKIENKQYGVFRLIPETETLEDIAIAVIMASYEYAQVFGRGVLRAFGTQMTKEMAEEMLQGKDVSHDYASNNNSPNYVYMDYVFGRCCKTQVKVKDVFVEVSISERDRNPQAILERAQEILKEHK